MKKEVSAKRKNRGIQFQFIVRSRRRGERGEGDVLNGEERERWRRRKKEDRERKKEGDRGILGIS